MAHIHSVLTQVGVQASIQDFGAELKAAAARKS